MGLKTRRALAGGKRDLLAGLGGQEAAPAEETVDAAPCALRAGALAVTDGNRDGNAGRCGMEGDGGKDEKLKEPLPHSFSATIASSISVVRPPRIFSVTRPSLSRKNMVGRPLMPNLFLAAAPGSRSTG